ncbi:hypothetical protein GDO86_009102, partial [Hymenochirus boettgeri]
MEENDDSVVDENNSEEESDHEAVTGISLPLPQRNLTGRRGNAFHKTTSHCFILIREALVRQQWEKAAELMISYLQTLESGTTEAQRLAPEIIWRLGGEILLNHPKSTVDNVSMFYEQMKNIGIKNYLQISLEQAFYLLCNGQKEEAYRILTAAESWKYGKVPITQENSIKLIQAYRGLIEYQSWLDKKTAVNHRDMGYASRLSAVQEMGIFHQQAKIAFQGIITFPGVWDPFIQCYVDLLESSGDNQAIEKILRDYAYSSKNPANPNAHVYLYDFLKRTRASIETLIDVLQGLYVLVPSHKLMLEYTDLLKHSESEEHRHLALEVLFDLLDFSGWKQSIEAWTRLAKLLKKTFKRERQSWVVDLWNSRRSWWPVYHFTTAHATKDWQENQALSLRKALVSGVLLGKGCEYFRSVRRLGKGEKAKKIKTLKTFVKRYSC